MFRRKPLPLPQRRLGHRLSSHDVTGRNRCLCRWGRHRKVGAGGTAVIGQLIHTLIVKLIVTNTIKTKKPTESWAWMECLAEREGFEPSLGYYPKHAFQACDLNRSSTSPLVLLFVGPASAGQGDWRCRADFSRPMLNGGLKSALRQPYVRPAISPYICPTSVRPMRAGREF